MSKQDGVGQKDLSQKQSPVKFTGTENIHFVLTDCAYYVGIKFPALVDYNGSHVFSRRGSTNMQLSEQRDLVQRRELHRHSKSFVFTDFLLTQLYVLCVLYVQYAQYVHYAQYVPYVLHVLHLL